MADDRLYLVCARCEEFFFLSKYGPGEGAEIAPLKPYDPNEGEPHGEKIIEFINEHMAKHHEYALDLGAQPLFVIGGESMPSRETK